MKLYKLIMFRLSKKDTPPVLAAKVLETLREHGEQTADIKFYLSDSSSMSASGIERVLKHAPMLNKYKFPVPSEPERFEPPYAMSNLSEDWDSCNLNGCTDPLSPELMVEIINGIPRRFPINEATFIIDSLSILRSSPEKAATRPVPYHAKGDFRTDCRFYAGSPVNLNTYPSPCIILQSNWWITGRQNFLYAIVELDEEDIPEGADSLQAKTSTFVKNLGEIEYEAPFAVPSTLAESTIIKDKLLIGQQWIESKYSDQGHLPQFQYPHSLAGLSLQIHREGPISVKKAVIHNFSRLGFAYIPKYSGHGRNTMVKKTGNYNRIMLTFTVDKWGHSLSCECSIEGPLWKHQMNIPCSNNWYLNVYLNKQTDVEEIVENMAAVYHNLELDLIPKIDELYGEAPAWYTY
ncbi:hypothetical protein [Paenibacillus pedocola]|uniref:hypothetical protein n=1 Tax=Paenibacillus pedocola TaxID=3242193 RepID=UPI002877B1FF|nr:hypothetical protein [Paenibacillus typhae]